MMPGSVFILCAVTCLVCSLLLFRGYRRERVPLLLWSGICFLGLMVDNCMLYADVYVFHDVEMVVWRKIPGLIAIVALLYGLIWEGE